MRSCQLSLLTLSQSRVYLVLRHLLEYFKTTICTSSLKSAVYKPTHENQLFPDCSAFQELRNTVDAFSTKDLSSNTHRSEIIFQILVMNLQFGR